jgi:quinol monooxygenase YgiN
MGTEKAREYYKTYFQEPRLYISNYIRMEFIRGFVLSCINFYNVLCLDSIKNLSDAQSYWSNKYRTRELKNIIKLVSQLQSTRNLREDKEEAKSALADVIRRIMFRFKNELIDSGIDSSRCSRGKVDFEISRKSEEEDFIRFVEKFNDIEKHSNACSLKKLIQKNNEIINNYHNIVSELNKSSGQGFQKIEMELYSIINDENKVCNCKTCEKIGDSIIAFNCNSNFILHHTDESFDYLCPPLNIEHFKHPSETAIHKSLKASDQN